MISGAYSVRRGDVALSLSFRVVYCAFGQVPALSARPGISRVVELCATPDGSGVNGGGCSVRWAQLRAGALSFRCRSLRFPRTHEISCVVEIAVLPRSSTTTLTVGSLHSGRGEMEVLTRVRAAGRTIDFGVATTSAERAVIMAQRFRVYQRRGYYRPGVTVDRDEYDRRAIYFLATLSDGATPDVMLGSARFVLGEADSSFRFPAEHVFQIDFPDAFRAIPVALCGEVSRMVAERPEGLGLGGLLTPLGLIQAVSQYSQRYAFRAGLALIKRRFLRAFASAGVRLHEIAGGRLIYPADGLAAPYFYRHLDPVVPVYWLVDEIAPEAEQAIARYVDGQSPALSPPRESTRNDNESATNRQPAGRGQEA